MSTFERPAAVTALFVVFCFGALLFFALFGLQIAEVAAGRDRSATVSEVDVAILALAVRCVGMTRLFLMKADWARGRARHRPAGHDTRHFSPSCPGQRSHHARSRQHRALSHRHRDHLLCLPALPRREESLNSREGAEPQKISKESRKAGKSEISPIGENSYRSETQSPSRRRLVEFLLCCE